MDDNISTFGMVGTLSPQFEMLPWRIGADKGWYWEVVGKSSQKGWSEIGMEKGRERGV